MRLRAALALTSMTLLLPATASAGTVGHVRVAIDSHAEFPSYDQSARRHSVVILQAWQQDRLRMLKQANPGITVLVYKNLSFAAADTSWSGFASSGVTAREAERDGPGWFLRTTAGERFTSWGYDWLWAMDVGDPSYQARWADNVVSELRDHGWDGVFMDDTNPTMKHHYDVERVAEYPSDAAYAAATRSALAHIAPRVRAAGMLAFANIGSWAEYPRHARDWLGFLDGAMDEMFLKWGKRRDEGYASPGRWQTQLDELRDAQRHGKSFMAITHSARDDDRAARLGYATMLLGSKGRAYFALAADYTHETWFPEYDYDLGSPVGPVEVGPSEVHRRRFEHGLVLVNAGPAPREVAFRGVYSGSGLHRATGATMPPFSGLVLRAEGPADPAPAEAPIAVLATTTSPHQVELRWTGGGPAVKTFRILRNGRRVRTVRRHRMRDRRLRPGRRYRYQVVAVGKGGRKLGRSRGLRIRTPSTRSRRAAGASSRPALQAALSPRPRAWKRAFLERRVDGDWRRVSRSVRPRATMRFRLPRARRGRVRVVVEPADGGALRSSALRPRR